MVRKTQYDSYDDRFKATAVELGQLAGVKALDIAALLEIHPVMLYRWKKEYRNKTGHPCIGYPNVSCQLQPRSTPQILFNLVGVHLYSPLCQRLTFILTNNSP